MGKHKVLNISKPFKSLRKKWLFSFMIAFILIVLIGGFAMAERSIDQEDQYAGAKDTTLSDYQNDQSITDDIEADIQNDSSEECLSKNLVNNAESNDVNAINDSLIETSLQIDNYSDEEVPDASFAVNYSDGKTVTVHYGRIDGTTFTENGLHSCQPNNLNRDAIGTSFSENIIYIEHYVQEIKYENTVYTFQSAYAYAKPNESDAVFATAFSRTANNEWAVRGSNNSWQTKSDSNNMDVYLVFKPQSQNSTFDIKRTPTSKLTVKAVDENGNDLPGGVTTGDFSGGTSNINLFEYVNTHIVYRWNKDKKDWDTYTFDSMSPASPAKITNIRYTNSNWRYTTNYSEPSSSTRTTIADNSTITLKFTKSVDTVDSASRGININLFDYDAWAGPGNDYYDYGINSVNPNFSDFKFSIGSVGKVRFRMNQWHNDWDKLATQGIWKNKLINGVPYLDKFGKEEKYHINQDSLAYLFMPGGAAVQSGYKSDFLNLNNFFDKAVYDSTGYYEYNSSKNYMSLDRDNRKFIKHKNPATNNVRFMPFNYNRTSGQNDFLFSQTIDCDFMQPKDGEVEWNDNTYEMNFEFNGDDDVFVYIDDVLVLDIGGLHAALNAKINFKTGKVENPDKATWSNDSNEASSNSGSQLGVQSSSLKKIFEAAGVTAQWKEGTETFADYTRHNMKIFYMERGEGQSNAYFKFNLASMPEKSIQVGKGRDYADDHIAHVQENYEYYIEKKVPGGSYEAFKGDYEIYEGDVGCLNKLVGTGYSSDGTIKIKAGQVAILPNFELEDTYNVYEYDPKMRSEITEYKWNFEVNSILRDETKYREIGGKVYWGLENKAVKDLAGLQFKNVYDTQLYSVKIYRNDSLSRINNSDIKVLFDGAVPYNGIHYDVYDSETGESVRKVTIDGVINDLPYDNSKYIVIPNVEMSVHITVETNDTRSRTTTNTYTQDQIENVSHTAISIDGDVPSDISKVKVMQSTIKLQLSEKPNNNLNISKNIKGKYSDLSKQFEMNATLYLDNGNPYNPGKETHFEGIITRKGMAPEAIEAVVDNGKIQIVTIDEEQHKYVYSNAKLSDGDVLTINNAMPYGGYISLWEEKVEVKAENYVASATINNVDAELTKNSEGWISTNKGPFSIEAPVDVKFTNTIEDIVPTGIEGSTWWIILLTIAGLVVLTATIKISYKMHMARKR